MEPHAAKLAEFVRYVRVYLRGDEKGEAQIFCERLLQAFGHPGIREVGGELEYRVHQGKSTRFADLLWRPRLLLEMKKRGEKLQRHYQQALEYWLHLVPNRPEYVVLCNFDEFWIYDLNQQLDEPMDRVALDDLPQRFTALNFLSPQKKTPLFQNDRVAVTRTAADKVARVFNAMLKRGEDRDRAQRFILQCVVALFAQSIDLLPHGLLAELLAECRKGGSSYDLIGGLFRQMNSETPARGGHFVDVPYFNGGLFAVVNPIELTGFERDLLADAASENWAKVKPPVFGTLFEGSMDAEERHAFGAHFTSEADIQKVVLPTIVRPWRERIAAARTARDLLALRRELLHYHVLDPACGSGNFLYIAYRELKRVEMDLLDKISTNFGMKYRGSVRETSVVSAGQFHGIDIKPFAVELAKVTLMLAKKLALDESEARIASGQAHLPFDVAEHALPLDNLDANIRCDDALFCDWPQAQAIIGNPPYQSKNKMQQEYGPDYVQKVRARSPGVPGRADYCVYWFRRAHDELAPGGRAGLVGTNTIRQNYSREGGLDYIVGNGGTITEAVSTQVWSGEAAVHVSIVNWIKGECPGVKKLLFQRGDHQESPWEIVELEEINSALSVGFDVTKAERLQTNIMSRGCYTVATPVFPARRNVLEPKEQSSGGA
jgi:type II restriction/modification system DNA methylase subunit YeeA